MRVSLLRNTCNNKASSRKIVSRPSLATLFPTLFAFSSTVQVQCFASSSSSSSTGFALWKPSLVPSAFLPTTVRLGGALHKNGRALFSTTEESSTDTAATTTTTSSITMTPAEKLQALRARMQELDLDVYLVPSDDPHLSGKFAVVASSRV